jgi:hypothetical protein
MGDTFEVRELLSNNLCLCLLENSILDVGFLAENLSKYAKAYFVKF